MSATEPERLALHKAARAALGEDEGDTLMAMSPPANTDIATRQDVERVEERLDARIDALGQRLDARIDALEQRLDARIAQAVNDMGSTLTRRIHHAELRTMGVVVVAVLGSNLIG